jgi:hypothetical protein
MCIFTTHTASHKEISAQSDAWVTLIEGHLRVIQEKEAKGLSKKLTPLQIMALTPDEKWGKTLVTRYSYFQKYGPRNPEEAFLTEVLFWHPLDSYGKELLKKLLLTQEERAREKESRIAKLLALLRNVYK